MTEEMEVLQTANEYMKSLHSGILNILNQIDSKVSEQLVYDIAEGISWVVEVLMKTEHIHHLSVSVNEIAEILESMLEALQNQDNILLKDILKYDIVEQLETWLDSVEKYLLK